MANFKFKSSSAYQFTDPIRTFKANDPYAYFVDNIPLKQLAENTNWLKDQLINIDNLIDIERSDVNELRPYVTGSDRLVRVLPGKFTARINDARQDPHQFVNLMDPGLAAFGHIDNFKVPLAAEGGLYRDKEGQWGDVDANLNDKILAVLDRFKDSLATGANGLGERAFTYPVQSDEVAFSYTDPLEPKVNPFPPTTYAKVPPFPLSQVISWTQNKDTESGLVTQWFDIQQRYDSNNTRIGFSDLPRLESWFIKRWRGVARTAIVNVPSELSLTVPPFDPEDFFYYDKEGTKILIEGPVTRIDLIFIYSKAVDQDETTIGRFVGNLPTIINTPVLGIVKGAGVGVRYGPNAGDAGGEVTWNQPESVVTTNTESKMLPNVGDQDSTSNGFTDLNIHGSFPSPDDLLNQAPLLLTNLTQTEPELVGQSVLPVAYVVTRSTDTVIESSDLVDIRPFFRTAELAYNERAGIAAAIPQLSLANPAVGKAVLEKELGQAKTYIDSTVKALEVRESERARIVGTGLVQGGYNYGVEGALAHYYYDTDDNVIGGDVESARAAIMRDSSLPNDTTMSLNPQWDPPFWSTQADAWNGKDDKGDPWLGERANDWVNPVYHYGLSNYGCFESLAQVENGINNKNDPDDEVWGINSTNRLRQLNSNHASNGVVLGSQFMSVSKTIQLNRTNVPWMVDYDVDVRYWNCMPIMDSAVRFDHSKNAAGFGGIWVEKSVDSFTIFCAWVANMAGGRADGLPVDTNPRLYRDGDMFSGHIVMTDGLRTMSETERTENLAFSGESGIGLCIYPSVTYTITGIPSAWGGANYNGESNITLH